MNIISGKEALIALANGEEVEFKHHIHGWVTCLGLNIEQLLHGIYPQLRIKPRTITLNGIEVPAPFEPKEGEECWVLNEDITHRDGYKLILAHKNDHNYNFGSWRTEEEIKQVVDALRKVFKEPQQ